MPSKKPTTKDIVAHIREWSIEQAQRGTANTDNASSIIAEFAEWIEPDEDQLEIWSPGNKE